MKINCIPSALNNTSMDGMMKDSDFTWDDATWILTSSFIIFTMQTGVSKRPYESRN